MESVRDAEKDVKDLKGNKILSTEAKNILSDLELDTDDESGGSLLCNGTVILAEKLSSKLCFLKKNSIMNKPKSKVEYLLKRGIVMF